MSYDSREIPAGVNAADIAFHIHELIAYDNRPQFGRIETGGTYSSPG